MSRRTRCRLRIRGCSRSSAAWLSDSTLPSADSTNPNAAASASGRGDSDGRWADGRRSRTGPRSSPNSQEEQHADGRATACATVRSFGDRPWRCINQTTPIAASANVIGPLSPTSARRRDAGDAPAERDQVVAGHHRGERAEHQAVGEERRRRRRPPAGLPSVSRTLPYSPPRTNSARASRSAARTATLSSTTASTAQGPAAEAGGGDARR